MCSRQDESGLQPITAPEPDRLLAVVELPFPLPKRNRLHRMNPYLEGKLRQWLHNAVSACIASTHTDRTGQTQMAFRLKRSWMELYGGEYFKMIRPRSSDRSRSSRTK